MNGKDFELNALENNNTPLFGFTVVLSRNMVSYVGLAACL